MKKCEKPHYDVLRVLEKSRTRSWYDRAPAVEVRRSAPLVVAEVEVPRKAGEGGDDAMRDALSRGFRQIASYIFGRNAAAAAAEAGVEADPRFLDGSTMGGGSGKKIAMTSPVVTEMPPAAASAANAAPPSSSSVSATETAKGYVVAFVMPASAYKSAAELPRPTNPNVKLRDVPAKTSAVLGWRGGPRADEAMVAARRAELDEILGRNGIRAMEGAGTTLNQYYPPFAPAWQRLCEISVDVEEPATATE